MTTQASTAPLRSCRLHSLTLAPSTVPDASLTNLGREQSRQLNQDTKDTIQTDADLLVCSPVSTPLSTTALWPH